MTQSHASILGVGEWRPETVRDNAAWPANFGAGRRGGEGNVLTNITTREDDPCAQIIARHLLREGHDPFLGTRERRVAGPEITSHEAEARAAKAAIADAGLEPSDIDVVMSYALTPERPGLSSAPWVMDRLGMKRALAMGVDTACASTITQLMMARALVQSRQARYVLLTQSHLATRVMPFIHPASPNLGDVATAAVVGPSSEPGIVMHAGETHGEYADAVVWTRPRVNEKPWWEPGATFLLGTLDAKAAEELVARTVHIARDTLGELFTRAEVSPQQVAALCSVQPRKWIPAAIAEATGIDPTRAPNTFEELAHVGASGVLVNLVQARKEQLIEAGSWVAFYAQGAGFTRAACLVRWTPPR